MWSRCCVVLISVILFMAAACGSDDGPTGPGGDDPAEDTTAPAAVADLHIISFDETAVTIGWTAPGDDGSTGTASGYQIGYSVSPITSESWAGCTMLGSCPEPAPAGIQQSVQILAPPVPDVYLAMRAVDEADNWSGLSNVAHGHLSAASNWTTYRTTDGLAHDLVAGIAVAADGTLWCTHPVEGGGGVSRFDGTTWKNYTTLDGLPSNLMLWFQAVAIGPEGDVWVGTYDHGLAGFDGNDWTVYTTEDGLLSDLIVAVAASPDGDLWCAGPGVSHFDGEQWSTYGPGAVGLPQYVLSIAVAPDGSCWAGGMGLRHFEGGAWIDYGAHHPYDRGPIVSIAFTPEGTMWVAGDGVSSFDGQTWEHFGLVDMGLVEDGETEMSSIAVASDGTVWAGTSLQGVVRYDGASWQGFTVVEGLADDTVFSVAAGPGGVVWVGTERGISRYSSP